MSIIKNDIVSLRAVEPLDINNIFEWENDIDLWETSSLNREPRSRYSLVMFIEQCAGDFFERGMLRLMIVRSEGDVVGYIEIYNYNKYMQHAEIGIFIDPKYQGKGYGAAAIALATQYGEGQLGLQQVYAYVLDDNKPSLKLFSKVGYQRVGVVQRWFRNSSGYHDMIMFQHLKPLDNR